ncbi:MAG: alpha-amylase family glycosyl hydrolase, partial [Marinibacterium sp.]
WDPRRQQYYLHNFLASQPDLNFHCPAVQDALLDVARFWLDRGVDGFRLDTINFYFHDKDLRDNPALPPEARNDTIAPRVNPYNHQEHLYSKNRPENLGFLERLRALTDTYDARACLGEVGDAQRGLEILGQYTAGDRRMHMCYAFEFLENRPATATRIVEVFDRLAAEAPSGWPCWAFSNHDVMRHASRWALSDAAIRAYAMLILCLRGSVCLYQGEELGLREAEVPFEALRDPYGIEFWPEFKGRDGCRTPMVWEVQSENAGFGGGTPWLPVSADQANAAVDRQEADPDAILHHYRRAIALRHAQPALMHGTQSGLTADGDLLTFLRRHGDGDVFCAFNLCEDPVPLALPAGKWRNLSGAPVDCGELGPWDHLIAAREDG